MDNVVSNTLVCIAPNEMVSDYMVGVLSHFGANLHSLLPADDILTVINEQKPAGVILYHRLKTAGGNDTLELIRNRSLFPNVPVLLYSFQPSASDAFVDPDIAHITIPVSREVLLDTIDRVMFLNAG